MTAIDVKAETAAGATRIRTFAFSYLTYAAFYLTRLNFAAALPSMGSELGYPKLLFGLIGGCFSAVYALGLIVNGRMVERLGAKKLITLGLIASATVNILFGYAELAIAMVVLWAINGYAQSTGWPSVVKIVSDWFSGGSRGKVGGIFGTCFLAGSMAALALSGFIQAEFGWRALFTLPSLVVIASTIPFSAFVRERMEVATAGHGMKPDRKSILSREVLTIVAAYVLLQIVRSGLSLWAPTFLFEVQAMPLIHASYGAAIIPLGGVFGSIASGWASDRFHGSRRIPIMAVMTVGLSLALLLLHGYEQLGSVGGVSLLFFIGLSLYGPHVILSTIIPMDRSQSYGAANLAGLIDGLGYVGMMFADPLIGWIVDCGGWGDAITFWTLSSICTTLLLLTIWRKEGERDKLLHGCPF